MPGRRRHLGSCEDCGGWGLISANGLCRWCGAWARHGHARGRCRRCGHTARLGRDGICRACLVEIRYTDPAWVDAEQRGLPPQPPPGLPLTLLLDGVRPAIAQPIRKSVGPRRRRDRPALARALQSGVVADDERICPAQIPGQLAMLRSPRVFTNDHAQRIKDRPIPDLDTARVGIDAVTRERGLGEQSRHVLVNMARLALSGRDPNQRRVFEDDLHQIPQQRTALAHALARVGLLQPAHAATPLSSSGAPRILMARSCEHCLSWSGKTERLCKGCRGFAATHAGAGRCRRCRRWLPVADGLCRFCQLVLNSGCGDLAARDQLWLGGDLAPRLIARTAGTARKSWSERVPQQAAVPLHPVSGHFVDPHQLGLFELPARDWSGPNLAALPSLTVQAQVLVNELDRVARTGNWHRHARYAAIRTLTILVSWLGASAPIEERDVRAVTALGQPAAPRRVIHFLQARQLLRSDAEPPRGHEAAVGRRVAALPAQFIAEVDTWIQVLRGTAQRPSTVTSWTAIHGYLTYVTPVLQEWGGRMDSLRAVTGTDVEAAIAVRTGNSPHNVHTALRSLFRALKRERVIFADPARHVTGRFARKLPTPLPSDRLRGLLDRTDSSRARFAVALVAIHALHIEQLRQLLLADLDRPRGQLVVRKPGCTHHLFLDELCLTLAKQWLKERSDRSPATANAHLFVSRQTALDSSHPPMSRFGMTRMFTPLGITPNQLRVDRLLDEAYHTADPVHLMRVFGIGKTTAIRYVRAAHPDRFAIDPTAS